MILLKTDSIRTSSLGKTYFFSQTINFPFYPNPAKDEITVESPNSETLTLINLQGKILAKFILDNSENALKVQLPYLEGSSFIIRVQSEDKVITKKLQIVN